MQAHGQGEATMGAGRRGRLVPALRRRWRRSTPVIGLLVILGAVLCQEKVLHPAVFEKPILTLACLAAGLAVAFSRGLRVAQSVFDGLMAARTRVFRWLLFLASLGINVAMALWVFAGIPRLDDGVASLFQARIFARLSVTLPLPPSPGFFKIFGMLGPGTDLNHWCGMYPPAWPALLTPGVWLGCPWLINPLLGAGLCVAVSVLGEALYGRRTGRTAGILAAGSSFVYVLSGTHLSHVATALCGVLCCLAVHRLLGTGRWFWGLAAGCAWGIAFLCRPLTALAVGIVLAAWIVTQPRQALRAWRGVLAGALAAAAAAGLLLWFQAITTGDPLTAGHSIGMGPRGRYGFVRLDGSRTHTLWLGLKYTLWRLRVLNDGLLGWPLPALALLGVPFRLGRAGRRELLLLAPLPMLIAVFAAYWYYESCFPARYLFESLPFLFILISRALMLAARRLARQRPAWSRVFAAVVIGSVLFSLAVSAPAHLSRYSPRFGDVEAVLPRVMKAQGIRNAVVFMDAKKRAEGEMDPMNDYYATGFMRNDLDLRGDIIYVRNSRERNPEIIEHYPDRRYYLYRYLRDVDRAHLWELFPENGGFRAVPVTPATPLLIPPPSPSE